MSNIKSDRIATVHDLGADPELLARADAVMTFATDRASIQTGYAKKAGDMPTFVTVPRYGLVSLALKRMPVHLFNPEVAPSLAAIVATAATDGGAIWINQDYLRQGLEEEDASNGEALFFLPLLAHEAIHAVLQHPYRLREYPRRAANFGADDKVDAMVSMLFTDSRYASAFDCGGTLRAGHNEQALHAAEEFLILKYLDKPKIDKNKKKGDESQKGDPKGRGEGKQSGAGQGQGQQPGQKPGQQTMRPGGAPVSAAGQPSAGPHQPGAQPGKDSGPPRDGADNAPDFQNSDHIPTPQEIAAALAADGLQDAARARGLPEPGDKEAIRAMEENARRTMEGAIRDAQQENARSGGLLPGGPVLDVAVETLSNLHKGKVNWLLSIRDTFMGNGQKVIKDPGAFPVIAMVDPITESVGTPLWGDGDLQPISSNRIMVWIFDTSGSMDLETDLRDAVSEAFRLQSEVENTNDGPVRVLMFMADTAVRSEMIEINEGNWEQIARAGIKLKGRGGTDMEAAIREVLHHPEVVSQKAKHIDLVLVSDMQTAIPRFRPEDFADVGRIEFTLTYLAVPSACQNMSHLQAFAEGVAETGAQLVAIDPKKQVIEIDLTAAEVLRPNAPPTTSAPRRRR